MMDEAARDGPTINGNGSVVFHAMPIGLAPEMRRLVFPATCHIREFAEHKNVEERRAVIVVYSDKGDMTAAHLAAERALEHNHAERAGVLDLKEMGFDHSPDQFVDWWTEAIGMGHYDSRSDFIALAEQRTKWTRRNESDGPIGDFEQDDLPILASEWPAPPALAAYQGLAGAIAQTIEPETEADPVALLAQLLVAFGSLIGRSAHIAVGAAWHYGNEFTVLVGETSAARKGSSLSEIMRFIGPADPEWHYLSGLSSGEGLIYHVRDPVVTKEAIKVSGKITGYQDVISDHGVADKRLLVVESEFGGVLKVLSREGNKLSAVVRQAWDGGKLATMTKAFPYRASDAHVSIIGHITADELTQLLTQCDQANGFANRMLWICCRRSKLLPFGGQVSQPDVDHLQAKLSEAVAFAKNITAVHWSRDAMDLWETAYPRLTRSRPGVLGMVTSRAEAHALRLALIYALMDLSITIEPRHLEAALAVWDYCERSAAYVFGSKLGDKDADAIFQALQAAPAGLTRTEIRRGVFSGHKPGEVIASKLGKLLQQGLVRSETIATAGAPAERWFSVAPCAASAPGAKTTGFTAHAGANGASSAGRNGETLIAGRSSAD